MIKVAVCGYLGRMGSATCDVVSDAQDLELVCGIDPNSSTSEIDSTHSDIKSYQSVSSALDAEDVDVLVDFTRPDAVFENVKCALLKGVNCVVGTTGLSTDELKELASYAKDDACLFFAPNFTTGAVLMMAFAKAAAPYFPQAEIIEYHHCNKLDSPSGTAIQTARLISEARNGRPSEAPGRETESEEGACARGALIDGIPVHSIRSMGFVADQEVIFGSFGQSLTIRHTSWDRQSYMPGVLLGIRSVVDSSGLVVGLDSFMDI